MKGVLRQIPIQIRVNGQGFVPDFRWWLIKLKRILTQLNNRIRPEIQPREFSLKNNKILILWPKNYKNFVFQNDIKIEMYFN